MERFVIKLIEDLRQVTIQMKPSPESREFVEAYPDHLPDLKDMSYVDDYLYGNRQPISVITRIATEQLPPVKKLTVDQQALLAVHLEDFLKNFHFQLDFPRDYPHHLRYPFIRNIWEEEHVAMKVGETHIEFCNYDEETCPFTGYCKVCDDVRAMEISLQNLNNDKNGNLEELDPFAISDDSSSIEDISDLHNGHGNKVDLTAIPIPLLCTICKSNRLDDWDDHLLCLMNRNDQQNKKEFKCGSFEME